MINIDIVQNKEFSIGYPYNSPIDSYFKSLSPEFISNYNITDADLEEINIHKRAVQKFDSDLFSLMEDVSIFVQSYKNINDNITNKYDEQIEEYQTFVISKQNLEAEKASLETEILFMEENKQKLEADLIQTTELLEHYETQLMTYTIVDPISYIATLNSDIVVIESTISSITSSIDFYLDGVDIAINDLVEKTELISMYSFEEVLLKKSFESWSLRTEQYYKYLVLFYKSEYETTWTPGASIMYDKNIDYVASSKHIVDNNSSKLASELIRLHKFEIEKKIKMYAINLVNTQPDIAPSVLQDNITENHILLLKLEIEDLSTELASKQFAIDSIISPNEFKDYNTYKELIQLKRHYISSNIGTISEDADDVGIFQYDDRIAALNDTYTQTELKLGEKTYLKYHYSFEQTETIIAELKHELDILKLTTTGVILVDSDVDVIEEKIRVYTNIKDDLIPKIIEINNTNSLKLIEKVEISDNITLVTSNMFATEKLINTFIGAYEESFAQRLPQFYDNSELTQNEVIKYIVTGNIDYSTILGFESIKSYNSTLIWWDDENKENLFSMYAEILSLISITMKNQWAVEFNHPAIQNIKSDFYKGYTESLVLNLYARIAQYMNYKEYNPSIEEELLELISVIKIVLNDYIPMAVISNRDVSIITLFYDYTKIVTFDTSIFTSEEINTNIIGYIMNNYNYLVDINLSFKLEQTQAQEQLKIDLMWQNMEIKNG